MQHATTTLHDDNTWGYESCIEFVYINLRTGPPSQPTNPTTTLHDNNTSGYDSCIEFAYINLRTGAPSQPYINSLLSPRRKSTSVRKNDWCKVYLYIMLSLQGIKALRSLKWMRTKYSLIEGILWTWSSFFLKIPKHHNMGNLHVKSI